MPPSIRPTSKIEVWTDPFDQDLVRAIERVPGVKEAIGRRLIDVRAKRGDESWKSLTLVGVSDFASDIYRLTPLEGTQFPGKNEVVISQDMVHTSGFHPGDNLKIELPDGSHHTLTVAGLVTDQTTAKPDVSASNNAFLTLKTLESFGLNDRFNQLYVTVQGDGSDSKLIADTAASIKDKIEKSRRTVYRMNERLSNEHPMTGSALAVIGMLGALGILNTILSSSLIINTLSALLAQQLRQIGIMKLVGGRAKSE
jgi:putative ABC transport system permease protein